MFEAQLGNLVNQALQDTSVNLARLVDAVLKEDQVLKSLFLESKDEQVLEVLKVLAAHMVQEECQADKVYQVFQADRVWMVNAVFVEHQVIAEKLVILVKQVTLEVQVKMLRTEKKASKVHKVWLKLLV